VLFRSLVPVSITNQLEFYLGVRTSTNYGNDSSIDEGKFDGSRIFYNP